MRVRPRTFLIGLVLLVLIGLVVLLLPILSDPDRLKTLILQQVEASLGRKIEVEEASLELFPRPRLTLSRVTIRDTDPSQIFIKARQFDLVLRSTPLLRREVVVKRMSIERPQITLRRNQAGQWNFLTAGRATAGTDGLIGNPLELLLMLQETSIADGVVTVIDEFRPDGQRTIELTDLDLAVATTPPGLPIDVRLSGKIPTGLAESSLSLAGTVTRAAPNPAIPTGAHVLSLQFQGALDLLNIDLRQMMDFFGPRPIPDRVHGSATLKSRVRLMPGVSGYDMVLSDMTASVEGLGIAGQASLSGVMTAQPTFALTVSATPVSLDELLSRFPIQWLPAQLQRVLIERDIKGRVEVVAATVTGSTAPEPHASVSGEFKVLEGQALLGRDRILTRNLSGTVRLDPDRLRATDITGNYGPMKITTGKLAIAFLDEGPSLDLDVGGTMAAAELVTMLKTSASPAISSALAGLHEVRGETAVTFQISGLLNDPEGPSVTSAEIGLQDARFTNPRLTEAVTGLDGRLVYSRAGLEFDRLTGKIGSSPFEMYGTIETGEPAQFKGFSIWLQTTASQIRSVVAPAAKGEPAVQGPVGLAVSLAGPVTTPQIKGVVQFDQAEVSFPGILHKPSGLPAAVEFDATLTRERALSVSRMDLSMPPVRLSGKGTVRFDPVLRVESSLIAGPVPLSELPAGMVLGGFSSGTLEISLDLRGRGDDWKRWMLTGWLALTDGRLADPVADHAVTDIYLRAQLLRNGLDLKRLEFRISDSFVRVAGTIRNWRNRPLITATVESPDLDLDLLIPKGERSPARDALEDLAATSGVAMSVAITRGRYKHLTINDLSGRIAIGEDTLSVTQIAGQIGEGTLDGRIVVRLPQRKPAEGEVKIQLTSVPYEQITPLFDEQRRVVITGDLTLTATLQGHGRNPLGLANTLNGTVEYQITNGRLIKGILVPRILTILDIPNRLRGTLDLSGQGMPFDRNSATVTIRNGIATTDNWLIDSPVVKIAMAGSYDIPTDQINAEAVVSPFGSYTKLLQSIPLFGKLFKGERQGFTTAFLDIKGSFADPRIESHPMRSIGAGITGLAQLAADVLINTLKLPAEIIVPDDGKAAPPPADRAPDKRAPAAQPASPAPNAAPAPSASP